jgi:hypothetical protein
MVPVKAVASVFRPHVEIDFIESLTQEVLPGEVIGVRPVKGTRSWSIQVTEGRVRIRDAREPNGTGLFLEQLDAHFVDPTCYSGFGSDIFIANESEAPAVVGLQFQGRR